MIISASRRTDIPKFYAEWFMNRIREGFCTYPGPYNQSQIVTLSLKPEDVDVIAFWTKDPGPMLKFLPELTARGFCFYFHYTLNGYAAVFEPGVPSPEQGIETFRTLARAIGPDRVIWRYDPIIISSATPPRFHIENFGRIAGRLSGYTHTVVLSLLDEYRSLASRLRALEACGVNVTSDAALNPDEMTEMLRELALAAEKAGMAAVSCAEGHPSFAGAGIQPGRCVDPAMIERVFGIHVPARKDPAQRPLCGCAPSRDLGVYGTCRHGCVYCYAAGAGAPPEPHDLQSPSLAGWYDPAKPVPPTGPGQQGKLF